MNSQTELLAALQRDISERLRPICEGLPEETFQELVRDIALVKLKYATEGDHPASFRAPAGQLTT